MAQRKVRDHPKLFYLFIAIICLANLLFLIWMILSVGDIKESIASNKVVASIVTSEEDEEFIEKVCEDLGLENEVNMLIGPYYIHSFFSRSQNYQLDHLLSRYPIIVDPTEPTRRILMKESIYTEIDTDERRAAIAHEIWHIHSIIEGFHVSGVDSEIEADRFAAKYIHPDVLIGLLNKYGNNDASIQMRIQKLENQKLIMRGGVG